LAAEKFAEMGRLLVIAIDVSIWNFQVQAGKEGANPVIRTFYYRLCRLFSLPVRAVFVFDGPAKPPFKRNERKGLMPDTMETKMIKSLIRAFGYEIWTAPGEAEAECAFLQQRGAVDLVLSEDVDSLMFGATKVVREIPGKDRNAVMVYEGLEKVGLDRDRLVLVALMSGGDYMPSGLFGFGPKVALEVSPLPHLVLVNSRSRDHSMQIRF
jgi:holliday junction resolvase YEN1